MTTSTHLASSLPSTALAAQCRVTVVAGPAPRQECHVVFHHVARRRSTLPATPSPADRIWSLEDIAAAIAEREKRGDMVESRFVSIDSAEITAAEVRGRNIQATVRFQSKLISVTRNKEGNVIDGNAEKVTDVTDVWTFARDVSSRDPNWKLVATEAEAEPGH